jgi:hypothetical protein
LSPDQLDAKVSTQLLSKYPAKETTTPAGAAANRTSKKTKTSRTKKRKLNQKLI